MKYRIYSLKNNALNELDRLQLAQLLLKAGYTVRLGKERQGTKNNSAYVHFVEYWDDGRTTER